MAPHGAVSACNMPEPSLRRAAASGDESKQQSFVCLFSSCEQKKRGPLALVGDWASSGGSLRGTHGQARCRNR